MSVPAERVSEPVRGGGCRADGHAPAAGCYGDGAAAVGVGDRRVPAVVGDGDVAAVAGPAADDDACEGGLYRGQVGVGDSERAAAAVHANGGGCTGRLDGQRAGAGDAVGAAAQGERAIGLQGQVVRGHSQAGGGDASRTGNQRRRATRRIRGGGEKIGVGSGAQRQAGMPVVTSVSSARVYCTVPVAPSTPTLLLAV